MWGSEVRRAVGRIMFAGQCLSSPLRPRLRCHGREKPPEAARGVHCCGVQRVVNVQSDEEAGGGGVGKGCHNAHHDRCPRFNHRAGRRDADEPGQDAVDDEHKGVAAEPEAADAKHGDRRGSWRHRSVPQL